MSCKVIHLFLAVNAERLPTAPSELPSRMLLASPSWQGTGKLFICPFRCKARIVTFTHSGGGADGSIVVFNSTELGFHANVGIDDILDTFSDSIHAHPEISPGD
jgi:hypothetical protein